MDMSTTRIIRMSTTEIESYLAAATDIDRLPVGYIPSDRFLSALQDELTARRNANEQAA